jgi:hypothetical protein
MILFLIVAISNNGSNSKYYSERPKWKEGLGWRSRVGVKRESVNGLNGSNWMGERRASEVALIRNEERSSKECVVVVVQRQAPESRSGRVYVREWYYEDRVKYMPPL